MKIKFHRIAMAAVALLAMFVQPFPVPSAPPEPDAPPGKVTPRAWTATRNAQRAGLIVTAAGFPDLSPARALPTKEAKTRFVVETLLRHAAQSQAGLRRDLDARSVRYQVLWINNSLFIPAADRATVRWLSARPDVASVDLDVQMRGVQAGWPAAESKIQNPKSKIQSPQSIEWGVSRVRAPDVWALGFTGQGIVVADLDTGVQWNHPALIGQYRGWNGSSADHNFNWYDAAYDLTGDTRSPFPHDDNGHGTHTVGTILGDDGGSNQIGVAPGAQWIACRNMRFGIGSVARYTLCFQFSLAPTDLNGNNPDPSKAADITSNSWGCDPGYGEIGCDVPSALVTVTQVLRDAGILTVAAAGNSGSGCSSVIHAPGTLDQAFSVGATDSANNIAGFSSRGPSSFTGHLKPDVVAPGVWVRSAVPPNSYNYLSGTSMATPHVAGVAALLWSAAPWLRGQISETEAILRSTAQPLTTSQTCGSLPAGAVPNNTYGYGLIDARAAVSEAQAVTTSIAAPAMQFVLEPLTYTIWITNQTALTRTGAVLTAGLPLSTALLWASDSPLVAGDVVTWPAVVLPPQAALSRTLAISVAQPHQVVFARHGVSYFGLTAQRQISAEPVATLVYAHRRWLIPVYR